MARDRTYRPQESIKKHKMSQDEIDSIREDAKNAQFLLLNPYFRAYCENTKKSILELHATQAIYDVTETTENNGVKKSISIPAKKEYTLLAGEYRFIDRFISDLEQTVQIAKEMESKIQSEEIEVLADDTE